MSVVEAHTAGQLVETVRRLMSRAWDEGREAGMYDYDDHLPDKTPNPYGENHG